MPKSSPDEEAAEELRHCLGTPLGETLGGSASPDFTRGAGPRFVAVGSAVVVLATAAQVQRDLTAYQSPAAEACIQQYALATLVKLLEDKGVSATTPEVTRLTTSSPSTFGFRVTLSAYGNGRRLPVTVDLLGVGRGRTEASLLTSSIGPLFRDDQRDALFAKIVARVKARAV